LRDQAAARGAALVLMTTHGRGPLSRAWLGSVAGELVERLPMPLLLVRPQRRHPDLADEPRLRHVLIALPATMVALQPPGRSRRPLPRISAATVWWARQGTA